MERAAQQCTNWLVDNVPEDVVIDVVCGSGNNGGDGLAIARQLLQQNRTVNVYYYESPGFSLDVMKNLERLSALDVVVMPISRQISNWNPTGGVLVDALFGSGLNRPLDGNYAELVDKINDLNTVVVSIDMPSGLFTEDNASTPNKSVIQADYTLTLEVPKLALLLPDNQEYTGRLVILPIGLNHREIARKPSIYHYITSEDIQHRLVPRDTFNHKGDFGHARLIAGSKGKMGAVILSAKGCLRTGVGLLTLHVPSLGYTILQTAVPEAMVEINPGESYLVKTAELENLTMGIGPGIGQRPETADFLLDLLTQAYHPMVLDADALNILSSNPNALKHIPENSILTPHPKEFERLVGSWENDTQKLEKLRNLAKQINSIIVLKGAHTAIADSNGAVYFNSTGNPGMATGGSGDVLTGMLTGLLAQEYSSIGAALIGVYLHGLAGDLAALEWGVEAMTPSDLIDNIGAAFLNTHTT